METLSCGQPRNIVADPEGNFALEDMNEFLPFMAILHALVVGLGLDRDPVTPQMLVRSGFAQRGVGIGLDALFVEGVRAMGDEARRAVYRQVQMILYEELPAIPLFHEEVVVIRRSGLDFFPPLDGRLGPLYHSTIAAHLD